MIFTLNKIIGISVLALVISALISSGACVRDSSCEDLKARVGTVLTVEGSVNVRSAESGEWVAATKDMTLNQKDRIRTGDMSSMDIALKGNSGDSIVHIDKNSEVIIDQLVTNEFTGNEKTLLDVAIGNILIKAAKLKGESKFEVSTPTSIVGVRGTGFEVSVSAVKE